MISLSPESSADLKVQDLSEHGESAGSIKLISLDSAWALSVEKG
jgi:hypothetical protein